MLEKYRNHS